MKDFTHTQHCSTQTKILIVLQIFFVTKEMYCFVLLYQSCILSNMQKGICSLQYVAVFWQYSYG